MAPTGRTGAPRLTHERLTHDRLTHDGVALAALFVVSGVGHLVRPQVFERIVPRWLPGARALVYISGVGELACAAGLLHPRTRRVAGWASAALLLAVLPANVQMAATAHEGARRVPGSRTRQAVRAATLARLPLQWPLVRAALRAAGALTPDA